LNSKTSNIMNMAYIVIIVKMKNLKQLRYLKTQQIKGSYDIRYM